ncbi:hypothetical protein [Lentzea indica]|uniref:hypothetical protein n=1 Tax=Lentzea indica TaxID=2604800 RepID=UPI00143C8EC3|nr:hypothetical protein [Lentzea indica]
MAVNAASSKGASWANGLVTDEGRSAVSEAVAPAVPIPRAVVNAYGLRFAYSS